MTLQDARTLAVLDAIESLSAVTQRALAGELGVSLGTANMLVRGLLERKLIVRGRDGNRYRITPAGRDEKFRLLQIQLPQRVDDYAAIRDQIGQRLAALGSGPKRVVFYGAGDIAQIAYAALARTELDLVGLIDDGKAGQTFFDFTVSDRRELDRCRFCGQEFDVLVLATHSHARKMCEKLAEHRVPPENILTLFE